MTTSTIVERMTALAEELHSGQVDKAGLPYVEHPRRVASYLLHNKILSQRLPADGPAREAVVVAALLHDTLEDVPGLTAEGLVERGAPLEAVTIVELLTRTGKSTAAYYEDIRNHPMARLVKFADLLDNTDPERLALLPEETRERLEVKYAAAFSALGLWRWCEEAVSGQ